MAASARFEWGLADISPSSPTTGSKECRTIFSEQLAQGHPLELGQALQDLHHGALHSHAELDPLDLPGVVHPLPPREST